MVEVVVIRKVTVHMIVEGHTSSHANALTKNIIAHHPCKTTRGGVSEKTPKCVEFEIYSMKASLNCRSAIKGVLKNTG